ncbi:hypothetical protein ACHWQZ_G006836 [Mnemiopsis leidyi]
MSEEPGSSSSGWWGLGSNVTNNLTSSVGSFWNKAKETSSYVYEFTANDFNEVKTAVQQDIIAPSASALKHKLQPHAQYGSLTDSVATMLGNVSQYLAPEPQQVEYLSRYGEDRIRAIQTSKDTYLAHKTDDHYTDWSSTFTLEDHTHEISRLLVDNQKLRDLHTLLVPSELSYTNFWKIYYYRSELFSREKARHEALLSRVDKEEAEEELKWSDDEEDDEEETSQQTRSSEEKEEQTEGKEERTITEQTVSVESSTEGTVTPEKPIQDNNADSNAEETEEPREEVTERNQETESMQSSVVMSESADPKLEVSSEEGSYDVIKHKELECEGQTTSQNADEDEEFEKELDQMIENIKDEEDGDGDWEDWD